MSVLVTFLTKKYVDDWWHFCPQHHEAANITEINLESVGQFIEVPKMTFMKTRERSSSLAFNQEIQWSSDYFCIKNSILFKYLFIKRFTSSKNESIFNQFMFLSANMLKSEHLAKKTF